MNRGPHPHGPTTDWLAIIDDDRAVRGVFGDQRPALDGSRLVRGEWVRPAFVGRVTLGLALPEFPADPPRKYVGNNTIGITLTFEGVRDFHVDGVAGFEPGQITMTQPAAEDVRLTFVNRTTELHIASAFVLLSAITSYIYDPFAPPI